MRVKDFVWMLLLGGWMVNCSKPETPLQSEVRGVWITNIDSEVMFYADSIRIAMESLAAQGFNVVYPVVYNDGYTLYPSEVMRSTFGEEYVQDTVSLSLGIDPLEQITIEAHRVGMEVMPWFEFGFASSYKQAGGHIVQSHPHWAAKDHKGNLLSKNNFEWLNGIHPEVQQFILDLVVEVIQNYDVDGVQGDDRLPAMPAHGGYSTFTRALYEKETGRIVPENYSDSTFMLWKASKLSAFIELLYTTVKEKGDHLIVSSSPSVYPWSYDNYLQDSPTWYQKNIIDHLVPQVYRNDVDHYKSTLDQVLKYHPPSNQSPVLSAGILIKSGQQYNDSAYVQEALSYGRSLSSLKGEVYFFYEGLDEKNGNLGDYLAQHHYQHKALLPYRSSSYQRKMVHRILGSDESFTQMETTLIPNGALWIRSVQSNELFPVSISDGSNSVDHVFLNCASNQWIPIETKSLSGTSLVITVDRSQLRGTVELLYMEDKRK